MVVFQRWQVVVVVVVIPEMAGGGRWQAGRMAGSGFAGGAGGRHPGINGEQVRWPQNARSSQVASGRQVPGPRNGRW